MTSKEALLKIESFCAYYNEVDEAIGVIAKDLEVLEILKKLLIVTPYHETNYFTMNCILSPLNHEEFKKIQAWLDDDK